jgi:hypothetical protein
MLRWRKVASATLRIIACMPFTHPRLRRERRTIQLLHQVYCHDHHATPSGQLCPDCQALFDYAEQRLDHCPFQEKKSTCAQCTVHCYKPQMRARIREVMRYAGPRLLLRHPILTIRHLLDDRRKPPLLSQIDQE